MKRPLESYNKIWLGAISLALIGVIVAVIVMIGAAGIGYTRYQAQFVQAAQIRPGDQVTVAGISVGKVKKLKLAGNHVVVTFVARNDVHLGAQTRAAVKLTTILGSRYLQLTPAADGTLRDRTIPIANTTVPYDLQKTLADSTTTFEQVDADRVAESFTTLSRSLNGLPDALPLALDNVKSLAEVISGRRDQIGTLLKNVDSVTTLIRDERANLGSMVLQGREVLGEIATRREALKRLLASATALVDTLKRILDDSPGINGMLASLQDFTRMIGEHDALLRNTLQALPLPIRNLANASGSGNSIEVGAPGVPMIDSWMCAISGRAKQFNLVEYYKDCE
ncbi:MCE family protein [Mycobacteroides stephanolepidis]|nr:MCE family protein [[Mycobacterium] stephanolepidis]